MQRWVIAQHLLTDRHRRRQKLRARLAPLAEQRRHAVPDRVHRGLVPGIQQQDRGGHQFVGREGLPVGGTRDEQLRQHIVAGLRPTLLEQGAHPVAEGDRRSHGAILDRAIATHLIDGDHIV